MVRKFGKIIQKLDIIFIEEEEETLICFATRSLALKLRVMKIYDLPLPNLTQDNKKGEKALKRYFVKMCDIYFT